MSRSSLNADNMLSETLQPPWSELGLSLAGLSDDITDAEGQTFSVAIATPRDELKKEYLLQFSRVLKHCAVYWSDNSLALVFIGTAFRVATAECLNAVHQCWPDTSPSPLFIAVGHTVTGIDSIEYSYETARYMMRYDFTYSDDTVINLDSIVQASTAVDWSTKVVADYIMVNNRVGLRRTLRDWTFHYRANPTTESDIKIHISQLYIRLVMQLERSIQFRINERDVNQSIERIKTALSLDVLLQQLLTDFYQLTELISGRMDLPPEEQVLIFIRDHYNDAITLEHLAEQMNYNAAYLGRLIKKTLGVSFNTLRDEVRIDNAKRLLRESSLTVADIGQMVGIKDRDYFGSKFKSIVGCTPSEYRRRE